MAYAALRRVPSPRRSAPRARPKSFLAPTLGWVSATNLAASPPGSAQRLENFYPTTTGIRMRSGCQKHATASAAGEPAESLMAYIGGVTRKMFTAANGNIIDISNPADESVEPTADVTGQTSDYYTFANFATSGGYYMHVANGTDAMLIFDGTNWYPTSGTALVALNYDAETAPFTAGATLTGGTSGAQGNIVKVIDDGTTGTLWLNSVTGTFQDNEAITDSATGSATVNGTATQLIGAITGVTTSDISHVGVYRNRLWLVDNTMTVYYLPVDSITGAASSVNLAGVFRRGGHVMFTATWSFDAGDGPDDTIVFASSEGEFAVYQSDPADAAGWGLIGVYDASPPLGKNAHIRVGGDLLVLTEIGLVPLTAIKNKDPAALALAAVSRNIQPDWLQEVSTRRTLPWEIVKWTARNIAYVTCPVASAVTVTSPICFAVNLETGAWSKVTGWDTRCMVLHDDSVYFGTNAGLVMQADVSGADDGELIYYTYVGHADHLGTVGQTKTVRQARAVFRATADFNPKLSVSQDYQISLPSYPVATDVAARGDWDVGLWDDATWDAGLNFFNVTTQWVSIGVTGFAHHPQLQIVSGSLSTAKAELVAFDVLYEPGGFAV